MERIHSEHETTNEQRNWKQIVGALALVAIGAFLIDVGTSISHGFEQSIETPTAIQP